MKIARIARLMGLGALLCVSPVASASGKTPPSARPVALVYSLAGEAVLTAPGETPRPLRLFDRLAAGSTVELGTGARLALAFANGRRFELGASAKATLGRVDLSSRSGSVRSLPTAPPLPRLPAIADDDHPGLSAGAMRIRSATISGLYPDRGAASLASATRLYFDPSPAAPRFRVQVINPEGKIVFGIDTEAAEVTVPPEVLAPGRTYRWTVETIDRPGPVARGEAILVIVDAGRARAREKLRRWAQASGGADDLLLLEGVDLSLGLRTKPGRAAENADCPFSSPGVVVETVAPESVGLRIGLQPGDRLLSWCRAPSGDRGCRSREDLRTPFDWLDVELEEVQRGGVVLEGVRGTDNFRRNLVPAKQGLNVAPLLRGALAEAYEVARDRERAGDPASAARQLEQAAEMAAGSHCPVEELWLLDRALQNRAKALQGPEVDAGYSLALAKTRELNADHLETRFQMKWWWELLERGEFAQARQQLESALRREESDHPDRLIIALLLTRLGVTADRQDQLDEANRLNQRAYDLVRRVAPGSGAEAAAANNLSATMASRGDLAQSELYLARTLAIQETLAPSGAGIVVNLWNYAMLLLDRGDIAAAEPVLLRARRILENVKPGSIDLADTLHLLARAAEQRGDHDAAENLLRRGVTLFEKLDPNDSRIRDRLMELGKLALIQGQGKKSEELWLRALEISEKRNPKGPRSASCLLGLAEAARLQSRNLEAQDLVRRALAIWREIHPESLEAASIHLKLGLLLLENGNAPAAEFELLIAIRIREKFQVGVAEGYQALARLRVRSGQAEDASVSFSAAVDNLEAQEGRLGGTPESRWLFGSTLGDLYFEAAENQIALGRPMTAWNIIERGRARGFRELLAQKDLRFPKDLPAPLYSERRRLDSEYDKAQAALADWLPEQGSTTIETLQGRLRDLRLEKAELMDKFQRPSPYLGALERPVPLDVSAARSMLDPGTALLTYAVGESQSLLFVIAGEGSPGPGFSYYPLPAGKKTLADEIEAFRRVLNQPDTLSSMVQQGGRHLYDLLVRPAEPVLAKADRWLISPDGPLHSLPFAALAPGDHYLAERKPIHIAASAAVYKEIKELRPKGPSAATMEMLAVGDPLYPLELRKRSETDTDPQVQSALRRGLELGPLPATRGEVKSISDLFPTAHVLLGRDATEEAVKSLAPQARRLHFACHGLLDERFPLNSALALSIPDHHREGRANGLLQAWEVFEELRLNADLVTLSACDSGLGKEMGGEGLVGLVRAFQFAGARSVLASQWSVSDVSTAELMKRFYGHLRNGRSKDEALRAAQVDLIRSPKGEFSHPYYWAAFQLSGDWR